jgi:very-short-patch-repair endonuclease
MEAENGDGGMGDTDVSLILAEDLPTLKCGAVVREFRFHAQRKWRFDFALPDVKVAVEIQGGAWTNGRHVRGKGFLGDMEKFNAAAADGWKVFCFSPQQIRNGEAMNFLEKAIR